jgi:hypothetical protein
VARHRRRRRIGPEKFELRRRLLRHPSIVVVEKRQEVAGGFLEAPIARHRRACRASEADRPHAAVFGAQPSDDAGRVVIRAVVDDDHVEVALRLLQHASNRARETIATVSGGDDNGELRQPDDCRAASLLAGDSETLVVLSVVVPCRDRAGLLDDCLAALRHSVAEGDEIIVVDSASASAQVAGVAADHGARVVRCGWPGTSRARNLGARVATGDAVAFVDDDVRVSRGWAGALSACLDDHPGTAFVTGRISVPARQRDAHRPVAIADHDRALEFAGVDSAVLGHGANMAVRRPPFDAVGGFDESFGPGARYRAAEDHDLFDRLLAAGFAGRYDPAVAAEHEQWRQRWALVSLEWAYGIGTGARLARLRRTSPALAGSIVAASLWRDGLRTIPQSIRDGHELNVAFVGARLAATVAGFGAALLRR